jgi:hypothetical protein
VSSVTVENFSNGTITVAAAYNQFNGNIIVDGWWDIASNGSQVISAPDNMDLYLRVTASNGGEIDFANFNTFLFWPTNPSRFRLSKAADDPNVRIYEWGANLEQHTNNLATDPPPNGWTTQRFFRIGPINEKLQVQPS